MRQVRQRKDKQSDASLAATRHEESTKMAPQKVGIADAVSRGHEDGYDSSDC